MDASPPLLLPAPRSVRLLGGTVAIDPTVPPRGVIDPSVAPPQGYRLRVAPGGVTIVAADDAGLFYGAATFAQLPPRCPCLEIDDWPDFSVRGVLLDVSRDKVPTMATLRGLIDRLASWKINQIQLYVEHTFAYPSHPEVWQHASPLTPDEVEELDAFCRARFVELVPNQNSFGHMERWLKHDRYRPLAEAAGGSTLPSGARWEGPFSLCPIDPRSVELLASIYDEYLPHFTSRLFNVGCDETFDLGQGRSRAACEERGTTRVYLDFLKQVHALVKERGRRMMFWGDIILERPELIPELPKDAVALQWGYEADHPFARDGARFAAAGVPFYVCPGTSSWCSIAGRTDNMLANLRGAAEGGRAGGAAGYLNTDWGDYGHLQYLPVSYAGFAAGAAFSWCLDANRDLPLAALLDRLVFEDDAGVMGGLALDLGNVYQLLPQEPNGSRLFRLLVRTVTNKNPLNGLTRGTLDAAETSVASILSRLPAARLRCPDASVVTDEFRNAGAMLIHACRRGRWLLDPVGASPAALAGEVAGILAEHRRLWLARNRPGGLEDRCARLTERAAEYGRRERGAMNEEQ